MKKRRTALTQRTIKFASKAVARALWRLPEMHRATRVGIYMAEFGEVSCQPFVAAARVRGKRIFAPVLRKNALLYAPLRSDARVTRNRYGIPEPVHTQRQLIAPRDLDIVLVPLLAFDSDLNRLGMGGGYYDRSFAFRQRRRKFRKPRLVGLGYSFQHVSQLHPAPWDVPLDRVVTETKSLSGRQHPVPRVHR